MAEDWQNGGFGLYIHWPFCEAKCPYCDFNSHVSRSIDQSRWREAYLSEIDRVAALTSDRILDSVFFGGGTPSLMDPDTVAAIIDRVQRRWRFANDIEITLEANPGSVEAGKFAAFRQGGVNRISMGVQAMNDRDLKRLGRIHTVAEARAAFDIARGEFDRVSFDLIYARQDQSLADWRTELTEALSMAIDHLSLYQLTIEEGTAFGDRYARGKLRGLPPDDIAADMYEATQEICDKAGMPAYEVSNHAKPGAESRHNLIYWRYGDYAGIGPGAHGRLTLDGQKQATEAWLNPAKWLEERDKGQPEKLRETLSGSDQAAEMLMMGLRINEGVDLGRFSSLGGTLNADSLDFLVEQGLLVVGNNRIIPTPSGRMILNTVLQKLLED
ncbi:radical SAM family heme chaperone HemW [Shimia biformata]|uniref:radical SAM family heme chaperone HemW n=1 Tax=Shimia biformata TaxID=1294299 RepID=UPI0019503C45|nr:radical SAM family heme chaperone HemW [Shimia biformata]